MYYCITYKKKETKKKIEDEQVVIFANFSSYHLPNLHQFKPNLNSTTCLSHVPNLKLVN